jgi:UDP-glucose:(glucosyl)LPS beta-1,3-glucosyltransferase
MPVKHQPKVSVIIPAFNAQDFIHIPLLALKAQTYKNFEIIVVNDGSVDLTNEAVEKHLPEFSELRLISQPNNGVSSARNTGIRNSRGEFIVFVDSDDKVESEFLEELVKRQKETDGDAVYCGFYKWSQEGSRKEPKKFTENDVLKKRLLKELSFHVGCLMVRRNTLIRNEIFFDERLCLGEDLLFIYTLLCKTKIFATEKYLYHHLHRNNSVMNTLWTEKHYQKNIQAMRIIKEEISEIYSEKDKKDIIELLQLEEFYSQLSYLWKLMLSHQFDLTKKLIQNGYLHLPPNTRKKIKGTKNIKKTNILKTQNTTIWRVVSFLSKKRKKI